MEDLKNKFKKSPKKQRQILLGAMIVFISTFLPWSFSSIGVFGGFSYNGWHSFGMFTVLASVGLILLWLLPSFGVNLKFPIKTIELQKYLAMVMLVGPMLWLFRSGFHFGYLGLGFWVALVVSTITLSIFFKKTKS